MSVKLSQALQQLEQDYVTRTPNSKDAIATAAKVMPGGETRSVLHFSPYPIVLERAEGGVVTDVDGHSYRDFLNDFSAGLYGHSQPAIQAAIKSVVDKGLTFGGVNIYEAQFAEVLVNRFPALEKVRFTNSGTEANLMALATARAVTGRDKILVMKGGYHGNAIYISPSAARTNAPYDFVYGTFNDLAATEQAVQEAGSDIAAILVEPMMGAGGCIPGEKSFLQGLRNIADKTGALLVLDEVMTSRTGPTGAHGYYDIKPDLMCCGKYLGGGSNFGAFGGRADLMAIYDANHSGAIMHGGTFNNNVITMVAGLTGLRDIFTPEKAAEIHEIGTNFRESLNALADKKGVAIQATGLGSMMAFHTHKLEMKNPAQAAKTNLEALAVLHMAMLERGFYLARRGYMSLSIVQTEEDFSAFREAFSDVLDTYGELFNEAAQSIA